MNIDNSQGLTTLLNEKILAPYPKPWRLKLHGLEPVTLLNTLPSLLVIDLEGEEIEGFQFVTGRHVTSVAVIWFCGWNPLILSQHCVIFDVYMYCRSGDIKFLLCQVTSHSHIIKGTFGLVSECSSPLAIILPSFPFKDLVEVDMKRF